MTKSSGDALQINMHEAKSSLSRLGVLAWEGRRIVIAKAGKPYLDLIPHREPAKQRRPGRYAGEIVLAEDFDATSPELIAAFEGDER